MSLAPKLVVIDGGLTGAEAPVIPPASDADRIYLPATPTRAGDFAHLVAVSLTIHAVILAGALAWNVFGEERASGGTEELVVIEGVNVVMLDQLPSAPSPLVEASEIETNEDAVPVEETELAAVASADAPTSAEDVAETPPDPAKAMDVEARPPVEAPVTPDQAAEPAPTLAAETPAVSPTDESREVVEATGPDGETSEAPAAKTDVVSPVAEDKPVAKTDDLSVAADEAATPLQENELAKADALPAPTDDTAAPAEDQLAAALPSEDRQKPVPDAMAPAEDEPAKPAEAPPATEVAKDVAPAPEVVRDEAIKPVAPETKIADAPDPVAKPVEETQQAAVAPEPPQAVEPVTPKVEKAVAPKKKVEKKKEVASAPSPSAPASQATPTAKVPTKTKERAGAGGKTSKAQGKANISSYGAKVRAHLRRYQSYPAAALSKRLTGGAVVRITIGSGGRLVGATLGSSTGQAILDKEALAIARRASPYPPIPAGMSAQVVILAPIRFGTR